MLTAYRHAIAAVSLSVRHCSSTVYIITRQTDRETASSLQWTLGQRYSKDLDRCTQDLLSSTLSDSERLVHDTPVRDNSVYTHTHTDICQPTDRQTDRHLSSTQWETTQSTHTHRQTPASLQTDRQTDRHLSSTQWETTQSTHTHTQTPASLQTDRQTDRHLSSTQWSYI